MKSLVAILLGALAFPIGASSILDCRSAISTEDTNQCASIYRDLAEQRMQRYLDASKQRFAANKPILASIDRAQKHWLSYRKDHCDAVFDIWTGTLTDSMALQCETKITQERTLQLWRTYLSSYASGQILPEPDLRQ